MVPFKKTGHIRKGVGGLNPTSHPDFLLFLAD
jgi:hypothetical protein